jgi:hypothetical protein
MQRVRPFERCYDTIFNLIPSHIHVSLRDAHGRNIFAINDSERESGRVDAAYDELKFISDTAEKFLAGVLDGLTDGTSLGTCCFINT